MMATTGATRRAKLQSNCHHQITHIQFFLQAGCSSKQQCQRTERKDYTADKGNEMNIIYLTA